MASIDQAIEQLEVSNRKLTSLSEEETKAIRTAVADATKEATVRVKAEYKEKKDAAREEARVAERAVKDAQARIQRALGPKHVQQPVRGRAKRGEREAQFLAYVEANPNLKLAEIARGIGIQHSAVNVLAKKAVAAGTVKRSAEKRYSLA
ncbi:MAG: MarR family transcriptional regulator [Solirubrobacterales bacterium]|nr:MarR family transcriptional regulator [Solirubrobacterales bacterium]